MIITTPLRSVVPGDKSPFSLPNLLISFQGTVLRKRSKFEVINLKIFIIVLFRVSNLEMA